MIDCSIIIPTYNRPDYLKRVLSYYSDYETYQIIVADSSPDAIKKLNEKSILSFSGLDIEHLSGYPPEIKLTYKIAEAVNHINTEYCVLCADDDFVIPNGINQSVDFLENNPDFAAAHGKYIAFSLKPNGENNPEFLWKPIYSSKSITFPDAEKRFRSHFSNYTPTFYAVHRAGFLKMIFAETAKFADDDRFGELLPSMLALIYGKMKCLDVLYVAREIIPTSGGRTSKRLSDFINDGSYGEKYANFKNCLSIHLSKQSQLNIKESERVVGKAMSAYLKPRFFNRLIGKMKDILDYLRLPDWIDRKIRKIYTELTKPGRIKRPSIEISPSSEYYEDFNKIRLHVLSDSKRR